MQWSLRNDPREPINALYVGSLVRSQGFLLQEWHALSQRMYGRLFNTAATRLLRALRFYLPILIAFYLTCENDRERAEFHNQ